MTYSDIIDYTQKLCKMHRIKDSLDIAHDILLSLKRKGILDDKWNLPDDKLNEFNNLFRVKRREYYKRENTEITGLIDKIEVEYEDANMKPKEIKIPDRMLIETFLKDKPLRDSLILQRYIKHGMSVREIAEDLYLPLDIVTEIVGKYEFLCQNTFPTLRKRAKLIRNIIVEREILDYSRPFRNKWVRIFKREGLSDKFLSVRR